MLPGRRWNPCSSQITCIDPVLPVPVMDRGDMAGRPFIGDQFPIQVHVPFFCRGRKGSPVFGMGI